MRKKIEEFEAVDDNNKTYRVIHYKSVISTGDLDNPHTTMLGLSEYCLGNGDSINQVSDTEFELLRTQIRIRRK